MLMQTLRIMHRTPLVMATALLTSVSAFAQTEISTEAQLKAIANDLSGTYVLKNDITLSDAEWTPIGTSDHPFKGTLDGNGHTIKGLTVGNGANDDKAFFGFTNGATVKNIGFTSAVVKGHNQAAIVVAKATSSTLSNIYVSGVVTGRDHVGTIAGDARDNTTITNCVSTAAALSTEHQGGGIAGWTNNSTFSYNIAYGAVTAPSNGAGGITGMVDDNGKTEYQSNLSAAPYIKGGNDRTHGINGWCNSNCSNTGNNNLSWANTVYYVGGNKKKATEITEPSNGSGKHGTVTSTEELTKAATYTKIGFKDGNDGTWKLEDGQWPRLKQFATMYDAFTSISALPDNIESGKNVTVTATTALNRDITITSSNNDIISVDGHTLKAEKSGACEITITSTTDDLAQGASKTFTITVKAVDFHPISSADELDNLRKDMTASYVLTTDIDMKDINFVPFGIVNNENASKFTGTFDGNGHTIKNLRYDVEGKGEVGLFSQTENATIKNLIIENAHFKGNANVGGIVGRMYRTTITDCAVLNSYIEGRDHVGAIAGEIAQTEVDGNYVGGTITNCFSDARIKTREYQAGGMLGTIHCGTVEKNLFTGTVEGREGDNANGMVSLIDKDNAPSLIQYNVVAAAHIYGKIGRVVSNNRFDKKGKATKNFVSTNTWVGTKADNATMAKYTDPNDYNGADIPVNELRTQQFYTNTLGWDFNNHWTFLPNAEGKMYPVLKIMEGKTLPNTFWHKPTATTLTYASGEEKVSIEGMHSSYGQCIIPTLTKGSDIAIIDGNDIKAKESAYTLVGEGEVTASLDIDSDIASLFSGTTQDEITFNIVNGTETIATADEFVSKLKANADGHYVLSNDIDLKDKDLSALGKSNTYTFKGSINGQGHKVSNASLTQEENQENIGIIAKTEGAVLRNIAFVDYCVNTNDQGKHVGLIGSAKNTIFNNVYARGSVFGNDHVALLAGDGNGCTLTNCMVDGSVKARSQVGGFFGCTLEDGATFNQCLATGNLRTTYRGWEGGFIGLVDKLSTISIQQCASAMKCWSYGVTDSERNTQPFIGGNGAGGANALVFFNNNLVSSEFISDAPEKAWPNRNRTIDGGNVTDATTYTTSEAQTSYNENGWDLGTTWTLNTGAAYPVLTTFASVAAHKGVTLEAENDNASKIKTANNAISDVSLTRTLEANIWNTFCVPFAFEVEKSALAGAEVKEFDKIDGTTMYMKDATYVLPGRPYLVMPAETDIVNPTFSAVAIYDEAATKVGNDTYALTGIYSPKTISEDNIYGVKANGAIAKGKMGTTIKGLRAYFIINNGIEAKINFGDDETTGIENIVTPTAISNQKVYNLNGQYVGNDLKAMPKGIYIVNGKKVIK